MDRATGRGCPRLRGSRGTGGGDPHAAILFSGRSEAAGTATIKASGTAYRTQPHGGKPDYLSRPVHFKAAFHQGANRVGSSAFRGTQAPAQRGGDAFDAARRRT
jgi:hypothetical protein